MRWKPCRRSAWRGHGSRCPSCGHALRWHENLPLIGWLRLKGRCSACGTRHLQRYPLVELATAALFAACGWKFGAQPQTLLWCAAVALMVAMALIDLDTTYLPDDLTLPLIGLGLLGAGLGWTGTSLEDAAWGAVAGYGALWLLAFSYKKLRGEEGMGEGDFKLLAGLGALLGWQTVAVDRAAGLGRRRRGRHRADRLRRPQARGADSLRPVPGGRRHRGHLLRPDAVPAVVSDDLRSRCTSA